jgi:hypothetical protein
LVATSECIRFGEEFGESFNPFLGAEEVSWYYFIDMTNSSSNVTRYQKNQSLHQI